MALKKITLTEEHIKLLQAIKFESFVFDGDSRNGRIGWGIDQYGPWGGNYPIEDIALILGHFQDAIPGTENDYDGWKFPIEYNIGKWADNMKSFLVSVMSYTDSKTLEELAKNSELIINLSGDKQFRK